jgi:hypothetical protein
MTSAAAEAFTRPVTKDVADEHARVRRLEVPMGGSGWGWSLLWRFTFVFSLATVTWLAPIWLLPYVNWARLGTYEIAQQFPLFPSTDADGRFYQHLIPFIVAVLWLVVDRKRKHEVQIAEFAQLMARYSIAFILSAYSLEKTFGGQGSATHISYHGLVPEYGIQSRGFALFVWLGHSIIYENFAALVEMLPLFLIPFRRTAAWGALIALAACVNVFIVNTGHWNNGLSLTPIGMVALPLALLAPHTNRLYQLFSGRVVEPMTVGYLTPPPWYWTPAALFKAVVILWSLYTHNHFFFAAGPHGWVSTLGGLYEVDRFVRNGKPEPMAVEYPQRWREVAIGRHTEDLTVATVDGTRLGFSIKMPGAQMDTGPDGPLARWTRTTSEPSGELPYQGVDMAGLERERTGDWKNPGVLRFTHPRPDDVTLSGIVRGDTIEAHLRRVVIDTLPLYRYRWYPEDWRVNFSRWMREHGVVYPY